MDWKMLALSAVWSALVALVVGWLYGRHLGGGPILPLRVGEWRKRMRRGVERMVAWLARGVTAVPPTPGQVEAETMASFQAHVDAHRAYVEEKQVGQSPFGGDELARFPADPRALGLVTEERFADLDSRVMQHNRAIHAIDRKLGTNDPHDEGDPHSVVARLRILDDLVKGVRTDRDSMQLRLAELESWRLNTFGHALPPTPLVLAPREDAPEPSSFALRAASLLADITYKDWLIILGEDHRGPDLPPLLYLQVRFRAADANAPAETTWSGRKWRLSPHMTNAEIVQTALKAVLTAEEHEAREAFRFRGRAIFGPHLSLSRLVELCDAPGSTVHRKERHA